MKIRAFSLLGLAAIAMVVGAACAEDGGGGGSSTSTGGGGTSAGGSTGQGGTTSQGGSAQGGTTGQGGQGTGGVPTEPACNAPAVAPSNGACALDNGVLLFTCNPVTNQGCPDGQACDVSGQSNFDCYPGNTAGLCQACDQSADNGPFCQAGMTCYAPDPSQQMNTGTLEQCARYCCDDGDCGGGTCVKSREGLPWFPQTPTIGVCLE